MIGADLADNIAMVRALLRHGGKVVVGDGHPVTPTLPMLVQLAQMVHAHDVQRAAEAGVEPTTLLEILLGTVVAGRLLNENEWLALAHSPELFDEATRAQLSKQLLEEDAALTHGRTMPHELTPHLTFTPRDVAKYRAETAQWLESPHGRGYYQDAINAGRQGIFTDRPGVAPAVALADAEAETLRAADLYFIDDDMCDLLRSAHASMPSFAPVAADLPSPTGFAVFAAPISTHHNRPWLEADVLIVDPGGGLVADVQQKMREYGTQIVAVSWRPHTLRPGHAHWAAGGVWFTFYAVPISKILGRSGDPMAHAFAAAGEQLPTLSPENEAVVAWYPGEGDDTAHRLHPKMGTTSWARIVLAAFQLAQQGNLSQTDTETIPARKVTKAKARRTGVRTTRPEQVRVVRLRQRLRAARDAAAPAEGSTRTYRWRWVVRGFWREQWYPKRAMHRPKWIAPYLKGPKDAPLLGGDKVIVVGVPPGVSAPAGSAQGQ